MDVTIKILKLTLEELSDIISIAFTGNEYMAIGYKGNPSTLHNCFEDNAAQILLDGGTILVADQEADGDTYGNLPKYRDNNGHVFYKVTLEDILKGASNLECLEMIQSLINGDVDMYTGWNLFQRIVFGEIIYG